MTEGLLATGDDPAASEAILRHLRVIPRIGLALLLLTVALMSAAARLA